MVVDKIENLKKELSKVHILLGDIGANKKVVEREVKVFGNGAHIVLPKEHVNKRVQVIIG